MTLIGLTSRDARITNDALRHYQRHKNDYDMPVGRNRRTAAGGTKIYKAYCKTAAGAATTITCYKDTDATGDEIEVNCSIAGGGTLNAAIPRLLDGTLIFVIKIGDDWHCLTIFQASVPCVCDTEA
jgi:hypothetical protein